MPSEDQTVRTADLDGQVEAAFERHKRGDLQYAHGVYHQVLARQPEHPTALHYLGLLAQQWGRPDEARRLLERSIQLDPTEPRAHNHLGLILINLGDTAAATQCFERALQIRPEFAEALNNLANAVRPRDLLQAIDLYRRALALNPRAPFAAYNLAQALNEENRVEEAVGLFQLTVELDPHHTEARHSLGVLLEQQGRFDEAVAHYSTLQRIDPTHVASLANLLDIRDRVPERDLIRRAHRRLKSAGVATEDQVKLHHGLGKHYERDGDFDQAFQHFERSKTLLGNQRLRFDLAAVRNGFSATMRAFQRPLFHSQQPVGSASERPIFVVGLPRSGTTLTEQILASHPDVFGAGELRKIPQLVKYLRPAYPECVGSMQAHELAELAQEYLNVLETLAPASALRITDKLPTNSLNLGFIAKLFPQARFVYCRRDPMDIALSCFTELFDLEQDYTTNFEDFGHYFLLHEQLMDHWHAVLAVDLFEVRYEELVNDPESVSRALVAHCQLNWSARCLDFTQTPRTVKTPSRWQVRQPIYRQSVGRWRNYARHMGGLTRILQESGYRYAAGSPACVANTRGTVNLTRGSAMPAPLPRPLESPIFIVAAPRSGSTLLFETLAQSDSCATLGGEAHWLVESVPSLKPDTGSVASNRLVAEQATDAVARHITASIMARLMDRSGAPVDAHSSRIFLEKTPKNALRIPFFARILPRARFLFLWRDPRENVSSIMEAWRSGRFTTYRHLQGFSGPWSLLLPPGYEALNGRPVEEIAAFQWRATNELILDDLQELGSERWMSLRYEDFVARPRESTEALWKWLGLELDDNLLRRLSEPLPLSIYTQTPPAAQKWRSNATEIGRILPQIEPLWRRLEAL